MNEQKTDTAWPPLPYEEWSDTLDSLHMKMQVAGKIKLALTPFQNHWWNAAFYVSSTGINSGPIPFNNMLFEMNFDFISHQLKIYTSGGVQKIIPLASCSVAEFYRELMNTLLSMGVEVTINKVPSEVNDPVPCDIDERSAYNTGYVHRWWELLVQSHIVFERFRSEFRGKSSPIHFFWGSFDLCGSRFCGRSCDPPPRSGSIMRFAENEENFTFGFWPGNKNYPRPAFYSYIYPPQKGIETIGAGPKPAAFNTNLGEFVLDLDEVRNSGAPEEMVMQFLEATYTGSVKLAGWDIVSYINHTPGKSS